MCGERHVTTQHHCCNIGTKTCRTVLWLTVRCSILRSRCVACWLVAKLKGKCKINIYYCIQMLRIKKMATWQPYWFTNLINLWMWPYLNDFYPSRNPPKQSKETKSVGHICFGCRSFFNLTCISVGYTHIQSLKEISQGVLKLLHGNQI